MQEAREYLPNFLYRDVRRREFSGVIHTGLHRCDHSIDILIDRE
jgi:hypothetical protein